MAIITFKFYNKIFKINYNEDEDVLENILGEYLSKIYNLPDWEVTSSDEDDYETYYWFHFYKDTPNGRKKIKMIEIDGNCFPQFEIISEFDYELAEEKEKEEDEKKRKISKRDENIKSLLEKYNNNINALIDIIKNDPAAKGWRERIQNAAQKVGLITNIGINAVEIIVEGETIGWVTRDDPDGWGYQLFFNEN